MSIFFARCKEFGIPLPASELLFHPKRKWRFDFAWPESRVALEVEGAVWTQGRHTRGSGFLADMKKYNAAASLGWRVFRCVPDTLTRTETLEMIKEAITQKGEQEHVCNR